MGQNYVSLKTVRMDHICTQLMEEFYCPTYNVDRVIDPTGAGDTFAGGFLGIFQK